MKILIIGGLSLPPINELMKHIDKDERLFTSSFHNHPWIYNLATGLSQIKDTEIVVLSVTNMIKRKYSFTLDNVNYILIPSEHRIKNALSFYIFEVKKIKKIIKKINPDIVHAQSRGYTTYAALQTNYPVVVTNHGQIKEHYNALGKKNYKYFVFRLYENMINRKVKYFIGVSLNCTNDCKKYISNNNVYLIENAINPVFFNQKEIKVQNTVLFVGSITKLKQVKELVIAVSKIENCKLRLIYQSADNNYLEEIKGIIKNKNIEDRIEFAGQKNQIELAEEIAKSTILCLPSTYESFGMVLAEAMAVGKPVIASDIEGPRTIVKHNYNGLLIEPGNITELTNALNTILNNDKFCKVLSFNAKKDAFNRYSPESVANRTFNVYKTILNKCQP